MPDLRPQIVAAAARRLAGKPALPSKRGWRTSAIGPSFLVAVGLACCAVASPAARAFVDPPVVVPPLQRSVMDQVNAVRREHGVQPLRLDAGLAAAARAHSLEMGKLGYFSHSSAGGQPFWRRVTRFYRTGSPPWAVGENLYWSSGEAEAFAVVEAWVESPAHRAILLKPAWRELGIGAAFVSAGPGVYGGSPVTIVTADFGVRRAA